MRLLSMFSCWMFFTFLSFSQIYISEVSDAGVDYHNEFLELYNNSNSPINLTNYKIIRVNASTNTSEYVYDIGTDEGGTGSEFIIPAQGFLIIARGNDKALFESEWGTLSGNSAFNTGNSNLYYGTGTVRRWRLRGNDGTANTDDGTLLDDSGQAVGGSGNRHYQLSIGGLWNQDSYTTATPGALDADQSLPVVLSYFQGIVQNEQVLLKWRMESEVNNAGFEIYRAPSANDEYVLLDSYRTNEELNGHVNSNLVYDYQYIDGTAFLGQTYYYKLADVDLEGRRTFHGPVAIKVLRNSSVMDASAITAGHFYLKPPFPNPFNPTTTITLDGSQIEQNNSEVQLSVYNIQGQKMRDLLTGILPGKAQYRVQWDGKNNDGQPVPAGNYFILLKVGKWRQSVKVCLLR